METLRLTPQVRASNLNLGTRSQRKKLIVELDGSESNVSPHHMNCDQVEAFTLLCVDAAEDVKSIVETWYVFPEKQKLVHTQSIDGLGAFNGGNLFVGEIIGRCD